LDLLERYIDPRDTKNLVRRAHLEEEISNEKIKIRAKYLFRYALSEEDPFHVLK
jgi:hypothetical protein